MKNIENFEFLKKQAYEYCLIHVKQRTERILKQITELETALTSETKSSAGDKHETGRAMIQLEREKLGQQLAEVEKTQQLLRKVPTTNNASTVSLGNLVITNVFNYYIAISAGEYKGEDKSVYCISMGTPIGHLLKGKSVHDVISFNGKPIKILSIH